MTTGKREMRPGQQQKETFVFHSCSSRCRRFSIGSELLKMSIAVYVYVIRSLKKKEKRKKKQTTSGEGTYAVGGLITWHTWALPARLACVTDVAARRVMMTVWHGSPVESTRERETWYAIDVQSSTQQHTTCPPSFPPPPSFLSSMSDAHRNDKNNTTKCEYKKNSWLANISVGLHFICISGLKWDQVWAHLNNGVRRCVCVGSFGSSSCWPGCLSSCDE